MTIEKENGTLLNMYAAVDIGGTKTLVTSFSEDGTLNESIKFPTPPEYEIFISELANNVDKLTTRDFKAVGVAVPEKIDHHKGTLIDGGNLHWRNISIEADMERIFQAPVRVENDAKTAAIAEARLAGPDFETVVYITFSTGIGVGVCVNGNIDNTLRDSEAGLMHVEHNDKMVPWEHLASGKAIVAKYGKRASELDDAKAWTEVAHQMAKGILTIIAIVQPDLILIGGGVGSHFAKFEKPLLEELKKYENPLAPTPPIKMAAHPEEAVVYGCYELAKDISHG